MTVSFFGPSRDWAGVATATLKLSERATLDDARRAIAAQFPGIAPKLNRVRLAVGDEFAPPGHVLQAGDNIAIIPPVTGGAPDPTTWIELVREPIDSARVRQFVGGDAGCGAVSMFDGVVRAMHDPVHGPLARLEYEAHGSMALVQMQRLADEAKRRWGATRMAIVHRLGGVGIGEVSVSIAVATPHRAESFEACRFLIDTLKRDVPIWKRDVFEDGSIEWVEPPVEENA